MTFRELPGAAPGQTALTGKLLVNTTGTGNITLELNGPAKQGPIKTRRSSSHTFEDVPPGTYTVSWTIYNNEKGTSPSVRIEAGKQASVSVP